MNAEQFLTLPTVKFSELGVADALIADNGFDCIKHWACVSVLKDERGELYVPCKCGQHFLEGQLDHDDNDTLVGLRRSVSS